MGLLEMRDARRRDVRDEWLLHEGPALEFDKCIAEQFGCSPWSVKDDRYMLRCVSGSQGAPPPALTPGQLDSLKWLWRNKPSEERVAAFDARAAQRFGLAKRAVTTARLANGWRFDPTSGGVMERDSNDQARKASAALLAAIIRQHGGMICRRDGTTVTEFVKTVATRKKPQAACQSDTCQRLCDVVRRIMAEMEVAA